LFAGRSDHILHIATPVARRFFHSKSNFDTKYLQAYAAWQVTIDWFYYLRFMLKRAHVLGDPQKGLTNKSKVN
jgi:hypothetical protein